MDVSGFVTTVIEEVKMWNIGAGKVTSSIGIAAANGLRFQNHLYGCLSILEMFAEEEADISSEKILIARDASDNEIKFDLISDFGKCGCEFGFLTDVRGIFDAWSDKYRAAWLWAWKEIGWKREIETVDEIERKLFEEISEIGLEYFQAAMASGELDQEMEKKALGLYEIKQRRRYEGQTRRRRGVTPIQRRRRFKKTRRHVTFDLEDEEA
jgi:hypothetical protein